MEEIKCVLLAFFALWAAIATIVARRLATQCKDKDEHINTLISASLR